MRRFPTAAPTPLPHREKCAVGRAEMGESIIRPQDSACWMHPRELGGGLAGRAAAAGSQAIALGSQQRGGGIGPLGQQRRRPADGAVAPVTAPVRGVVGAALAAVDLHHAVVRTCAGTRPGGRRGEQDEGGGEECDRQQAAHAPEPTTRARSR